MYSPFKATDLPSIETIKRSAQIGGGIGKIAVGVVILGGFYALCGGLVINGISITYKAVTEAANPYCEDDGSVNSMICSGMSNYCEAHPDSMFC